MNIIRFHKPSEILQFNLDNYGVLVGDAHILTGELFLLGGSPGVGKSKAGLALAVAGATREPWFGLTVKRNFKTMIVQNENGHFRLYQDINELKDVSLGILDEYIKISTPTTFGLNLQDKDLIAGLVNAIQAFKPEVVLFDPWNAMNDDDDSKTYGETFKAIRALMAMSGVNAAVGIICHTRKGRPDHKPEGRDFLKEFLGPTKLASVARSAFVMRHATTSPKDSRIIFTCCKNNNGVLGESSGWQMKNGLFVQADVDLETLASPSARKVIELPDIEAVFYEAPDGLKLKDAVTKLMEITGFADKTCYAALDLSKGKFKQYLHKSEDGLLHYLPPARRDESI